MYSKYLGNRTIIDFLSENIKEKPVIKIAEASSKQSNKPVVKKTDVWTPDLDLVLPINGDQIPGFSRLVNWSGWKGYEDDHLAHDFAAYIDSSGNCVLGLPEQTEVRAVADGVVIQVSQGLCEGDGYATFINIEHGPKGGEKFSSYHHVNPLVKYDQSVQKGEVIATLHKDSGTIEGRLVHLHFELVNGWNVAKGYRARHVDPGCIFPKLTDLTAAPQGKLEFKINGKSPKKIVIANFEKLLCTN
ncbi:M23 family metallopeptidase [archaeon]|nr:M23 family metallopeptidase [archaeon]